jgi:CBS domain containing-hemolysin-like protein
MLSTSIMIAILILISAFFSISEISLAASRKLKLKQMSEEGIDCAHHVLELQEHSGHFFTVIQIAVNAVAILAGMIGEPTLSPLITDLSTQFFTPKTAQTLGSIGSFLIITILFILCADLLPKRLGMIYPETIAIKIVTPIMWCIKLFKPLILLFDGLVNRILSIFGLRTSRLDQITSDDLYAMMHAGEEAGILQKQEKQIIENVFELENRSVSSSMTQREQIIFLRESDDQDRIKKTISDEPHSKFLVCRHEVDQILGYIDSKDILRRILHHKDIALKQGDLIKNVLIIPDSLTLSEVLNSFKHSGEDFAVILNEYALVVGIITLNDVLSAVMGDFANLGQEEHIVKRDDDSWLVDGATSMEDVWRTLMISDIENEPHHYETIAGFMMYKLRKIPKRTDSVDYAGYTFEVVDIDHFKIDQILVTRQKNLM